MMSEEPDAAYQRLMNQMATLENADQCREFLKDILTDNEIKNLSVRWGAMELIHCGFKANKTSEILSISSVTSRVARKTVKGSSKITKEKLSASLKERNISDMPIKKVRSL